MKECSQDVESTAAKTKQSPLTHMGHAREVPKMFQPCLFTEETFGKENVCGVCVCVCSVNKAQKKYICIYAAYVFFFPPVPPVLVWQLFIAGWWQGLAHSGTPHSTHPPVLACPGMEMHVVWQCSSIEKLSRECTRKTPVCLPDSSTTTRMISLITERGSHCPREHT